MTHGSIAGTPLLTTPRPPAVLPTSLTMKPRARRMKRTQWMGSISSKTSAMVLSADAFRCRQQSSVIDATPPGRGDSEKPLRIAVRQVRLSAPDQFRQNVLLLSQKCSVG